MSHILETLKEISFFDFLNHPLVVGFIEDHLKPILDEEIIILVEEMDAVLVVYITIALFLILAQIFKKCIKSSKV